MNTKNNTVIISGGTAGIGLEIAKLFAEPIGGQNGIPASEVATRFIQGFREDELEIRVGKTEDIYRSYLSNPAEALKMMNQNRK